MSKKSQEKPIIYYTNELEDEFSTAQITPIKIDENYDYLGGFPRKVGRLFWYQIIAKPLAFLFLKIKFRHKIVNKEVLKQAKGTGFFLYGNHTNDIADALIPTMIGHPIGVYVIVHPNNVSMPVLGKITPSLGALPLPDDLKAMKNFDTGWPWLLGIGICQGVGVLVLVAYAMRRLSSLEFGIVACIEPIEAALIGFLFYGEVIRAGQWCGFALVLSAIFAKSVMSRQTNIAPVQTAQATDEYEEEYNKNLIS